MLTFDEATHTYRYNGSVIPSATQVLNRVAVKKTDDARFTSFGQGEFFTGDDTAARFGRALHAVAACRLNNQPCEYDKALQPWVDGLEKFLKEHEFLLWESKRLYTIDWKTSTANQHHWHYQTAAYDQLVIANHDKNREPIFLVEEPMYHPLLKYAGTPDWVVGNPSAPITQRHRWTVRLTEGGYDSQKRRNLADASDFTMFNSILNTYHAA